MTPTELQALLDREGVPVEARAPLRIADTGAWWETECPGSRGTYIDDDLAELAHVGAMVKYAGENRAHPRMANGGKWYVLIADQTDYDLFTMIGPRPTLTEALAHACGRIAKEKP